MYTDKKNEAGAQLLLQSPSNDDLKYIIEYTDKKNEAWAQLLLQSPSNDDLKYIIRYTDKKNEAAIQLRKNFGIEADVNEEALMDQITTIVLENPKKLKMDKWHCRTSHCIGGHACIQNKVASEIEKKSNTELASFAVLPNYSHLFYQNDNTVLSFLKARVES